MKIFKKITTVKHHEREGTSEGVREHTRGGDPGRVFSNLSEEVDLGCVIPLSILETRADSVLLEWVKSDLLSGINEERIFKHLWGKTIDKIKKNDLKSISSDLARYLQENNKIYRFRIDLIEAVKLNKIAKGDYED